MMTAQLKEMDGSREWQQIGSKINWHHLLTSGDYRGMARFANEGPIMTKNRPKMRRFVFYFGGAVELIPL